MDAEALIQICSVGFYVCLAITVLSILIGALIFFRFDVPKIYSIRSGREVRKTVQKMKEENARTDRLRQDDFSYTSGSLSGQTGKSGQTGRSGQVGKSGQTGRSGQVDKSGQTVRPVPDGGETAPLRQTLPLPETSLLQEKPVVPSGFVFTLTQNVAVTHSNELV